MTDWLLAARALEVGGSAGQLGGWFWGGAEVETLLVGPSPLQQVVLPCRLSQVGVAWENYLLRPGKSTHHFRARGLRVRGTPQLEGLYPGKREGGGTRTSAAL